MQIAKSEWKKHFFLCFIDCYSVKQDISVTLIGMMYACVILQSMSLAGLFLTFEKEELVCDNNKILKKKSMFPWIIELYNEVKCLILAKK